MATINAVHGVNKYLWHRIEQEGILNISNYSGIVPIVPTEETAELVRIVESQPGITSHPYMVYNWSRVNITQMWAVKSDQVVYVLRSADQLKTRQITNLFDEEFSDWDEAAKRVNEYISDSRSTYLASPEQKAEYLDFDYKYIYATQLGGAEPVEQDNDSNETLITLNITFSTSNKYW